MRSKLIALAFGSAMLAAIGVPAIASAENVHPIDATSTNDITPLSTEADMSVCGTSGLPTGEADAGDPFLSGNPGEWLSGAFDPADTPVGAVADICGEAP